MVKGSRASKSSGLYEPPVELEGELVEGVSLDVLRQPKLVGAFSGLRRRLDALLAAGFLCRLYAVGLPERALIDGAYELVGAFLEGLSSGDAIVPLALEAQWGLLLEMGVEPVLDACVKCDSSQVQGFSEHDGGLLCSNCYSGHGFAVSRATVDGLRQVRDGLSGVEPPSHVVREIGRVYKHQLCHHLEVPERLFRPVLSQRRKS